MTIEKFTTVTAFRDTNTFNVVINEAVEIAKGYVDEDVVKFVNGILGSFVRAEFPEQE